MKWISLNGKIRNMENEKILAAQESVNYIKDGMIVGLGSGSTAEHMIRELGKKVAGGLDIKGVPSSEKTARLAQEVGISLITLEEAVILDINIDGADEFDPELRLIKGGGGALLREKILAHNSKSNVIITDSSKAVDRLGAFKLPVETIPFATQSIMAQLQKMELQPVLRKVGGAPYRTDENNFILDTDVSGKDDLNTLNQKVLEIPGVVETGLFLNYTDVLIIGKGDGVETLKRNT